MSHKSFRGSSKPPEFSSISRFIAAAFLVLPLAALASTQGPFDPPPLVNGLTDTFSSTSVDGSGAIGHAGGVTWTFSQIGLPTAAKTWWGPWLDQTYEFHPTPFQYNGGLSGPNKAVYTTSWPVSGSPGPCSIATVYQRFTMQFSSASPIVLDPTTSVGIPDDGSIGVLLRVTNGMSFSVHMLFEASSDNATWLPGIDFFGNAAVDNSCFANPFQTNFRGAFYYNNSAPTISTVANQTVYLASSAAAASVGPLTFTISDDGDPNQVTFANYSSSDQTAAQNASISAANNSNGIGGVSFTALPQTYGTQGHTHISFDAVDGLGATTTSGFDVLIDQPPILDTNTPLTVGQGASGTITQSLLNAIDPDTVNPAIFNVQGQPHNGTLYLNGSASPTSFTQADVNNGVLTYSQVGSCQTSDNFQFQVFDSDGGFANDPSQGTGPTSYSFGIIVNLTQTAPMAQSASYQTGLGASVSSNVQATSTDCGPPAITYQFGTPSHGNLSATNNSTGAFTYTPNLGYSGADSFTFTASTYSGTKISAPATVSFTIQNQPPTGQAATVVTHVNTAVSGNLVATDPDLPAQTLKYVITTPPTKGQLILSNASTGAFTYVPNSGVAGNDAFAFTANDGSLTSTPATIDVQVRQYPKAGDVLVTNQGSPSIVLFDPVSNQQSILSDDPLLHTPYGIVVQGNGNVLTTDGGSQSGLNPGYVLSIDPVSGAAIQFGTASLSPAPVGLVLEASGNVLVGNTVGGTIERLDGVNGTLIGSPFSLGAGTAPTGIAVAGDGTLWVNDAEIFTGGPTNNLYHVNANGSSPSVITSGNYLDAPAGIVLVGSTAYVSTVGPLAGPGKPTNIVAVDQSLGTQTLITSDGNLAGSPSIALAPTNHFYVTSVGNASIVDIDPAGGAQIVLTQGGLLQAPFELAVVPAPASGVDLSVAMTAPSSYIKETKPLVYTITVRNFGPDAATAAHITAATPPNVSGLTWTCTTNGSGSCTANGSGSLSDTMNVPIGAVLTYTVTATASLPETFTIYSVSVQPASGIKDVNLNNNRATSGLYEKIFADGFGP